jgi:hypothetical protein
MMFKIVSQKVDILHRIKEKVIQQRLETTECDEK